MKFKASKTDLSNLKYIERFPLIDDRGSLERIFCSNEFKDWGDYKISQINQTFTKKRGCLRGLHFQYAPNSEMKYVICLSGSVFDVVVDLRLGSETFGKWTAIELSADIHNGLLIPEGFAHGFQTLEDNVLMLYLHSCPYSPNSEGGLNSLDPDLDINWPLPIESRSKRDEDLPFLKKIEGVAL